MRKALTAIMLLGATSLAGVALAQTDVKPVAAAEEPGTAAPPMTPAPDARSLATDADVGEARRAYRAACNRHESPGFCECVTAGVAQVLMPEEVRVAARTIGERINAQGDTTTSPQTDTPPAGASSAERIAHVEGFYADACAQYRS